MKQTFKKAERLTGKKSFEKLFNTGKSLTSPPFRLVWMRAGDGAAVPARLGISVPKRLYAKAVERNKLKRRIREAYRKNKHILYAFLREKNLYIDLMVIYTAKNELSHAQTEEKVVACLQKMIGKLQ